MGNVRKHRLAGAGSGVTRNVGLIDLNRDNILRFVAANVTHIGTIVSVGIVAAKRTGDLGGTGFAADAIAGREIEVAKAGLVVSSYDVFHQRSNILTDIS